MTNNISCPPPVSWAQRRTDVFITFNIECKDPDIKIEKSSVYFKGLNVRDSKEYEVTIPLHDAVVPENSNFVNKGRLIDMVLRKENSTGPYWPSLTSHKKKPHYLKIDFNKWCDEDEDNEEPEENKEYDFMKMMQSMGVGEDGGDKKPSFDDLESDSDDENLPDLD